MPKKRVAVRKQLHEGQPFISLSFLSYSVMFLVKRKGRKLPYWFPDGVERLKHTTGILEESQKRYLMKAKIFTPLEKTVSESAKQMAWIPMTMVRSD